MKNLITKLSGYLMIASFIFVFIYIFFLLATPFLSSFSVLSCSIFMSILLTMKYFKVYLT